MIKWAIKAKKTGRYLTYDGDFSKSFDGIRLFDRKKDAVDNIKDGKGEQYEKTVKIEIKEIK